MSGWWIVAIVVGSTAVITGVIELAARRLFDHVNMPERDETAPPEDAP